MSRDKDRLDNIVDGIPDSVVEDAIFLLERLLEDFQADPQRFPVCPPIDI